MIRPSDPRRGTAILITLAMLFILSILAISFARLMSVERTAASLRATQTQAEMAAEAGFEEAAGILLEAFTARAWSDPVDRWVFRNDAGNDVGTGSSIRGAVRPSFRAGVYPAGHPLAGVGYSRILPSPDGRMEVSVAVKIESSAGKIFLNGGTLGGAATDGYNPRLVALVNDLVDALGRDASFPSSNLPADAGDRILAARPADGYRAVNDLVAVLGQAAVDELADFVTVHAWEDPAVVRPDPMVLQGWGQGALRSTPLALDPEPRAPIDLNVGCRPVLIASLMGLSAHVLERRAEPRASGAPNGYGWRVEATPPIDHDLARDIVDSILLRRETAGPFRTWDEFDQWLIGLEPSLPALTPVVVDVIRAAVNPNTRLNKFNPDRVLDRAVDKSDLAIDGYKTEWTLGPTGFFRIESLGRVVVENQLVGQAHLTVEYRLLSLERHTTEADFAAARVAADDDIELLPEAMADSARAATEDGQITLAKAPNDGPSGSLSFRVPLRTSFDADVGNPVAPRPAPPERVDDSGPATVVGPGQTDPSDLLPDGVYQEMTRGEFLIFDATDHRDWIEGGLEFWYKPDHGWDLDRETGTPGSSALLTILQPLADRKTTLVQQIVVKYFASRSRPEIFSRLRVYTTKRVAAPEVGGFAAIPAGYDYKTELTYRYTTWFPKPDPPQAMSNNGLTRDHGLEWEEGVWHHVALRWVNPTEHFLWIDGCAMKPLLWGKGVFNPTSSYLWNGIQMVSQLQLGGRFIEQYGVGGATDTHRIHANGTILGPRFYDDPTLVGQLFPMSGGAAMDMNAPPELYLPASGEFEGRLTIPAGRTVAWIAWTELRPHRAYEVYDSFNMAGRNVSIEADPNRPDIEVALRVSAGGPMVPIAGDGEGDGIGTVSADGQITYRVHLHDNGFQPFNVAPVLDDLTIAYLEPAILSWTLR